jgi:DNA polymerase III delta prime subunit
MIERNGFVNGLHKSCTGQNFDKELQKSNLNTTFNRYHFLKFLPHKDWKKISDSAITFDASLGFAERYGFRNSYGKAFQPYNITEKKPYDFVEAPLNFMDGTFHKYMKINPTKTADTIIDFFEKNQNNCLFSLLWHNTYFTEYKYNSFLQEYKKVIAYLYENKINIMTPQDIVSKFKITWEPLARKEIETRKE